MVNINFFGEDAELDHVAVAVQSIEQSVHDAVKIYDEVQKVNVAFLSLHGLKIELVESANDNSPVANILSKGQNIYHLCFKVDDLGKSIKTARSHGFHCIANPVEAVAFGNKKIAWVYSKMFGLFELLER